jgi:hypothetical protein
LERISEMFSGEMLGKKKNVSEPACSNKYQRMSKDSEREAQ